MNEIIYYRVLISFMFGVGLATICKWIFLKRKKPAQKYMYHVSEDNQWIDINKYPIPDALEQEILIHIPTYFLPVNTTNTQMLHYNKEGKMVYMNNVITHWLPLPEPPKLNNSK